MEWSRLAVRATGPAARNAAANSVASNLQQHDCLRPLERWFTRCIKPPTYVARRTLCVRVRSGWSQVQLGRSVCLSSLLRASIWSYSADVSLKGGGCLFLIFAAMGGHADLEGLDDAGKTWRGCCLGLQRAGALEPWLSDGSFPLPACA